MIVAENGYKLTYSAPQHTTQIWDDYSAERCGTKKRHNGYAMMWRQPWHNDYGAMDTWRWTRGCGSTRWSQHGKPLRRRSSIEHNNSMALRDGTSQRGMYAWHGDGRRDYASALEHGTHWM
eukprot:8380324-Pyramimonas_sp.AAC.1